MYLARSLILVSLSYAVIPMDEDSAREGTRKNNCHHWYFLKFNEMWFSLFAFLKQVDVASKA